eukprot:12677684-Alexandrium_andersonii.AAC.1
MAIFAFGLRRVAASRRRAARGARSEHVAHSTTSAIKRASARLSSAPGRAIRASAPSPCGHSPASRAVLADRLPERAWPNSRL